MTLELEAPLRESWHGPYTRASGGAAALLVYDGAVILSHRKRHLLALDEATQDLLWRYDYECGPYAVHEGLVFTWPGEHELHLIDARSGERRAVWPCRRPLSCFVQGDVLVGRYCLYGYDVHGLFSIDWRRGQRLWEKVVPRGRELVQEPRLAGRGLLLGYEDGTLECRSADHGEPIWQRRLTDLRYGPSEDSPWTWRGDAVTMGERLLVQIGGVISLSAETGEREWVLLGPSERAQTHDGLCYAVGGGSYWIVDPAGRVLAKRDLYEQLPPTHAHRECDAFLISETHAYVGMSQDGHFYAFDRETGALAWQYAIDSRGLLEKRSVIASDRHLYFGTGSHVYCLTEDPSSTKTSPPRAPGISPGLPQPSPTPPEPAETPSARERRSFLAALASCGWLEPLPSGLSDSIRERFSGDGPWPEPHHLCDIVLDSAYLTHEKPYLYLLGECARASHGPFTPGDVEEVHASDGIRLRFTHAGETFQTTLAPDVDDVDPRFFDLVNDALAAGGSELRFMKLGNWARSKLPGYALCLPDALERASAQGLLDCD